jgi:hypothetical protein
MNSSNLQRTTEVVMESTLWKKTEGIPVIIKPCPFCGETPVVDTINGAYYVTCRNVACQIKPFLRHEYSNKLNAINAWNRRYI